MRFWLSITVLLLVLTCLVSSTKNQSKRQHGHKAARSVHHAPAHKSAHKPTHNVAHKAVHKKAHKKTAPRRGSLSRLRVAKKNNIRARAIRAGTICGDRALNCQVVDSLCGEKAFTTVLTDYCRMNCGFCPPPQDKCKDKLPSQCKKWVGEGFCNSSFLSKQMIRSLCAKSCSMCGGKTNCNLGPNRFLSECLTTTCKNRKYQRNSGCKKYCKQHPNVCGSRPKPPQPPPSADCDADDKKFSTECLPTTCPKAENRNAQQCQQYCTQNPTVCGGTPPTDQTGEQCDASPADVGPTCLHHTCRKNDKKAIPECVEFCSADANLPDPACVGVEPKPDATCDDATNEFTDNCYKTTCRKATKKTEAKCKEHCDADPAKPECAKVEPGAAISCAENAPTELSAGCLVKSCRRAGNHNKDECKDTCEDVDKKASAMCYQVEPKTNAACDDATNEFSDQCKPYTCSKAAKKTDPQCVGFCDTSVDNAKLPACVDVATANPIAAPCDAEPAKYSDQCYFKVCRDATEKTSDKCRDHCKDKPQDLYCVNVEPPADYMGCNDAAKKYTDECLPVTCRFTAEKTNEKCKTWCDTRANDKTHPECYKVEPNADAPNNCDDAANEFSDTCRPRTCRKNDKKSADQCKDYCKEEDNAKKPECRFVEPPADPNCDPDDKKFTDVCLPISCRREALKLSSQCETYCKDAANAQKAACIY